MLRGLLISLLAVSLSQPAAAFPAIAQPSQTPGDAATPSVRSTATLVTVDIVVSDGGRPVKGLKQDSFRVFENGREQTLKDFEEHSTETQAAAQKKAAALPPHTYTNESIPDAAATILLLDALNTPMQDQAYARKQMIEYLKTVTPGTRIGIFTLSSRLRLAQGITTDITALLAALDSSRNGSKTSPLLDSQNEQNTVMQDLTQDSQNDPAMAVLSDFMAENAAFQTDLRVQNTLDAMKELAAYLSAVPGRKNVIWLSGSFPLSLKPDDTSGNPFVAMRGYSDQIHQVSSLLTSGRIAVYPVDARGLMPQTTFQAANSLTNYARPQGRGRQPRGGPGAFIRDTSQFMNQTQAEHDSMNQIAEETGGTAYYNANDLSGAVAAIQNGANYYTLTYVPDNKKLDGKFRQIGVKTSGANYHLAYRHGYFATAPVVHDPRDPKALADPASIALRFGAPPSSQLLFIARVLKEGDPALAGKPSQPGPAGFMAAKLKPPLKRYIVDYKADIHRVSFSDGPDHLSRAAMEVLALAYDEDGKAVNIAGRAFQLTLQPAEYQQVLQNGLVLHQEIDVPAGKMYLRLIVHDLVTDQIGSLELPLKQ